VGSNPTPRTITEPLEVIIFGLWLRKKGNRDGVKGYYEGITIIWDVEGYEKIFYAIFGHSAVYYSVHVISM
jgi:hypothetical protein